MKIELDEDLYWRVYRAVASSFIAASEHDELLKLLRAAHDRAAEDQEPAAGPSPGRV